MDVTGGPAVLSLAFLLQISLEVKEMQRVDGFTRYISPFAVEILTLLKFSIAQPPQHGSESNLRALRSQTPNFPFTCL